MRGNEIKYRGEMGCAVYCREKKMEEDKRRGEGRWQASWWEHDMMLPLDYYRDKLH